MSLISDIPMMPEKLGLGVMFSAKGAFMFGFFKRRQQASIDETVKKAMNIMADYGEYLERNPVTLEIVDETALPHKKADILNAILLGLLVQKDPGLRQAMISTALTLANFQPNIGKKPLHRHGIDFTNLNMNVPPPELLAAKFAAADDENKARYEALRPLIQKEVVEIGERIRIADQAFIKMQSKS